MGRHIAKNGCQSSNLNWIVVGNGDVMLAVFAGRQTQMAAGLPSDQVAEVPECPGKFLAGNIARELHFYHGREASHSDRHDFLAHEMEPKNFRRSLFVKMALHGVANLVPQCLHGVRFGKNRFPKRAGGESAFWRFFDEKNKLVHWWLQQISYTANNLCNSLLSRKDALQQFPVRVY